MEVRGRGRHEFMQMYCMVVNAVLSCRACKMLNKMLNMPLNILQIFFSCYCMTSISKSGCYVSGKEICNV